MSVGIPTTKANIDLQSGALAQQIMKWTRDATDFDHWLDTVPDADLEALGYTTDDVALLKSAAGDMAKLAGVFYGEIEQTPAYDFRTFIGRISGFQL